jgi:hypothetical protein
VRRTPNAGFNAVFRQLAVVDSCGSVGAGRFFEERKSPVRAKVGSSKFDPGAEQSLHPRLDHHLLVVARGTLPLASVELGAESEGRGDLFDLLFASDRQF